MDELVTVQRLPSYRIFLYLLFSNWFLRTDETETHDYFYNNFFFPIKSYRMHELEL